MPLVTTLHIPILTHKLSLPIPAFQVNLTESDTLEACIREAQPRKVIYCAVPRGDETLHRAVSVIGVERTLSAIDKIGSMEKLIYLSTNSVFSGLAGKNHEIDPPDPENRKDIYRVYAMTRAQGEQVALTRWQNSIVVRTANVDGRDIWGNLNPRLATLVNLLREGQPVKRFANRIISPTLVDNLVEALLEIVSDDFSYRGILHIAGSQALSDYEYAACLARFLRIDETLVQKDWVPNPSSTHIWNISLDVSFTQNLLKTRLLKVDEQLARIFSGRSNQ